MGWKWEVEAYQPIVDDEPELGYAYVQCYTGQSLLKAIRTMREVKKVSGCVRLSWR